MKRLPPSLYVSCYHRSYGCRTGAGGSGDMLRCRMSPVPSARTSGVVCGMGSNPPPGASRERLISSSPSPLIAQWQQRRRMHDAAIAPTLRSHNAATVAAIADNQISGSLLTAPPGPSSVCPPSSFTANTSGSTDHTPESLLLTQLQMLAKQDRGTPNIDRSTVVVDSRATGADVPVLSKSAGALAALVSDADMCASGSPDDSTLASSHNDVPAWRRGLELVQTASCVTAAVTEWLLFLCLRSRRSATDAAESLAAAPLEVCEGVYSAWRELHRGQKPESDVAAAADVANAVAVSTSAHQLQPSSPLMSDSPSSARAHLPRHRSPFSPKGIHHHYATYLLRELRHAQTAAVSHTAMRKGSSGTHGNDDDCKALMPTKDSDAAHAAPTHRMRYLLHRVLEVLLVHLPQDLAAAAAGSAAKTAEPTCGVKGRRSRQRQPSLRPTTALLVLEAARHAAPFHRQSSTLSGVGPSGNFSLLSFLWETAHSTGSPQDAPAVSPSPTHSALAAVAREAFETIMRSSATAPTDTSAAASQQQHHLQNDALVLYVAFLATICMPPMPERCLEVELQAIDSFVQAGSPTARQLGVPSPHQQQQAVSSGPPRSLVSADRAFRDESGSASSASALATAAGVRWLMATYLSPSSSSASSAPVSGPRAEASRRQWDLTRDAVVAALCRSNSLLMSGSREPSSVAPVHNQGVCGVPSSAPPAPLPWCAWMLRALLHDDAHQQQKSGSGTASLGGALRSDPDEMSTLALSIRLVMELRRHSQATLACHGSPRWEEHRQHRLDTMLRRPLQLVWATLLDAAVRGQLIPANSCSAAADNGVATQHSARTGSCPHGSTPAVLQRLCYPHYDKTQWRRGTVNLYMQLLDQWGESTQVRQVFAAVARREREWQLEVRKAVLAERRGLVSAGEEVGGGDEDDSTSIGDSEAEGLSTAEGQAAASTARADSHKPMVVRVFRRYRPALNLESCLITLRHCGFPRRVLAELWDGPAGAKDGSEGSEGSDGTPAAAAQAKLAGEVLQYMIGLLHLVERRPHRAAPSGGGADANREQESRGDGAKPPHALSAGGGPGANLADSTMEADGLPVSHWVAWIRKSCVPALAHLYQSAGLEDEWAQLGYGHE